MAHSVEARLPYLDYRLVSLLFNMPAEWKLKGPWNKFVLREAMVHRIPESIRIRADKMGFPTPTQKWFASELYEPLREVLTTQEARSRGIYNMGEILHDLERHRRGERNVTIRLLHVAQFEIWNKVVKDTHQLAVHGSLPIPDNPLTTDCSHAAR